MLCFSNNFLITKDCLFLNLKKQKNKNPLTIQDRHKQEPKIPA